VASAGEEELTAIDTGRQNEDECKWIFNRTCPDPEIRFYLFTRFNVNSSQLIHVEETTDASNISDSHFNADDPTKIVIHGFRGDMYQTTLYAMREGDP
jgi:pancreatic lipase-related protein 2